jgi:sulfatase maturation enzyme AslB (radical SAM superfamily)
MYLTVITTLSCNLRCTYCRVPYYKSEVQFIPKKYFIKAIDLLFTSKDKNLQLEFFGGEPLLLPFDYIKEVIEYGENKAKTLNKNIEFLITTNATMLNKEKVEYFKNHNITLIISIDGNPKSHNINRPQINCKSQTYPLVVKNLPFIFKNQINVYAYTVVTPSTIKYIVDSFNNLVNLGFKNIWIMVACGPKYEKKDIINLKINLDKLISVAIKALKNKDVAILNIKNWLPPMPLNTELSIDMDGNIASCVPNVLDYEGREKYKIAHIDDDNLNIDELQKKRISNTEAITVLYFLSRNGVLLPNLKNNIEAGLVFTKFREKLYKEIKKNNLLEKYEEITKKIGWR